MTKKRPNKKQLLVRFHNDLEKQCAAMRQGFEALLVRDDSWKKECKKYYRWISKLRNRARVLELSDTHTLAKDVALNCNRLANRKRNPKSEDFHQAIDMISSLLQVSEREHKEAQAQSDHPKETVLLALPEPPGHRIEAKPPVAEPITPAPQPVEMPTVTAEPVEKNVSIESDSEEQRKQRLLVVSEKGRIGDEIERFLEGQPYEMHFASSSLEAVGLMGKRFFHLIIFDAGIKDGNPAEFFKLIHNVSVNNTPSLLALTTLTTREALSNIDEQITYKTILRNELDRGEFLRAIKALLDPNWDANLELDMNHKERASGKMLIIDAQESTRTQLCQVLSSEGYEVFEASSAEEGTKRARELKPNVIILDTNLPGKGGVDLCRNWRDEPVLKSIPVLILSKDEDGHKARTEALRAGALGFLTKPPESPELLAQVGVLVKLTKMHSEMQERAVSLAIINMELEETKGELEKNKRELEKSSQYKSEFLAKMSHELRTPLTAMMGFAQTLLMSLKTPQEQGAIKTILRNGEHLMELINDILDISKIEAGRLDVTPCKCSPKHIMQDVQSLMRIKAEQKGLAFWVEYEGSVPEFIETDPVRLKQILINLVGNAIKFTSRGNVRINVHCDKAKEQICFQVADTGIGISPEQKEKLFKAFSQGDTEITRRFGGTGLGLTVSLQLAQMLGGSIAVESILGLGSSFTVTVSTGSLDDIEMIQVKSDDPKDFANESQKPTELKFFGRVLVAEDNPDNQKLLRFYFDKAQMEYNIVENGQLAVEQALGDHYEMVILDMQMPVLDGYETAKILRQRGFSKPIVALTADSMAEEAAKCMNSGCNKVLTKPYNWNELFNTLAEFLPHAPIDNSMPVPLHEIPLNDSTASFQADYTNPYAAQSAQSWGNAENLDPNQQIASGSFQQPQQWQAAPGLDAPSQVAGPQQPSVAPSYGQTMAQSHDPTSVDLQPFGVAQSAPMTSAGPVSIPVAPNCPVDPGYQQPTQQFATEPSYAQQYQQTPAQVTPPFEPQYAHPQQQQSVPAFEPQYQQPQQVPVAPVFEQPVVPPPAPQQQMVQPIAPTMPEQATIPPVAQQPSYQPPPIAQEPTRIIQPSDGADGQMPIFSEIYHSCPELQPIIMEFLEGLDKYQTDIASAIQNKDWNGLKQIAHDVSGVAGMYGYSYCSDFAKKLRLSAMQKDEPKIYDLSDKLLGNMRRMAAGRDQLKSSGQAVAPARETEVIVSELIDVKPELGPFIKDFLSSLGETINRMEQAARAMDWATMSVISNEASGTASLYGFPQFSVTAKEIEQAILTGNTAYVPQYVQKLSQMKDAMIRGGLG